MLSKQFHSKCNFSTTQGAQDHSYRGQILESSNGADGVAWAAMEKGAQLKRVYIKHPKLGSNEVRLHVDYCGICMSDVSAVNGKTPLNVYPMIVGHEIIGRVYQVGSDVNQFKVGDLVGVGPLRGCCQKCTYCLEGQEHMCEVMHEHVTINPWFGGFATSVQVPTSFLIKVPDGMQPEVAPALMCAGCTVFAPLKKYGKIAGKVAVMGIGGLGHLAVQYSRKMGMKTFALGNNESKRESALKLGADEYVNTNNPEQMKKFLGEKVDLIINTTDVQDVDTYMRALRKGTGVMVQIGLSHKPVSISAPEVLTNEWSYAGSCCSSVSVMKNMLDFSHVNGVKPISEYFKFEDLPAAFERTATGKANLRVVVDFTSFKWQH